MATLEQKKEELEDVKAVRFISSAFLEISAADMQRLRTRISENERYYHDIAHVYATVKQSAARRGHLSSMGGPSRKMRTVSVAFTSNKRFYGSINRDVVRRFLESIQKERTDCIVIGQTGIGVVEHAKDVPHCEHHLFEKDQPSAAESRAFLKRLEPYERIVMYYPTFVSVFRQDIQALDITYTPEPGDIDVNVDYIFEPELPNIVNFFERQVRFILFQRAMLETELARTASRFVAMTSSEQNSEELMRKISRTITQLHNASSNRKLLESLTGFAKFKEWKNH